MSFRIRIHGTSLCSVIVLAGCQGDSPKPAPLPEIREVVFRARENPPTLDPAYATRTFDGHLACLLHGGLVRCGPDGAVLPELAEDWELLDGNRIRFRLRPGLHFPSGRAFTAEDVVYSLDRLCFPRTASPNAWILEEVLGYREIRSGTAESLKGIRVLDGNTVEIEMGKPSATLLARLTMPGTRIVDREEVERRGQEYGRKPKGLGAWELLEWEDDSHVVFRPNKEYPDYNRNLDSIRFRLVPQDFTAGALFETGGLHVLNPLPISQAPHWKMFPRWEKEIETVQELNIYYLGFGTHRPPFDRPEVRQAIKSAIQGDRIRQTLFGDRARYAHGPIPPGLPGHFLNDPRPERDKRAETTSEKLDHEIELWFIESDSTTSLVMEAVQADLATAGFRCRLMRTDPTTYSRWRRDGKFDMFYGNWWADYPDPDNFIAPLFSSDSDSNHTRFSNSEVDQLIAGAKREWDSEKREDIYRKAVRIILEESPAIFLWHRSSEVIKQPWIRGYEPPRIFHGTLYLNLGIHR